VSITIATTAPDPAELPPPDELLHVTFTVRAAPFSVSRKFDAVKPVTAAPELSSTDTTTFFVVGHAVLSSLPTFTVNAPVAPPVLP
jgi:hypothetical protein